MGGGGCGGQVAAGRAACFIVRAPIDTAIAGHAADLEVTHNAVGGAALPGRALGVAGAGRAAGARLGAGQQLAYQAVGRALVIGGAEVDVGKRVQPARQYSAAWPGGSHGAVSKQ